MLIKYTSVDRLHSPRHAAVLGILIAHARLSLQRRRTALLATAARSECLVWRCAGAGTGPSDLPLR
jgi:hypothetical protein